MGGGASLSFLLGRALSFILHCSKHEGVGSHKIPLSLLELSQGKQMNLKVYTNEFYDFY